MRCIVHLSYIGGLLGRKQATLECEIDIDELRDNGDTSELYDVVCGAYPNNDWQDICCDYVDYHDAYVECYVTIS